MRFQRLTLQELEQRIVPAMVWTDLSLFPNRTLEHIFDSNGDEFSLQLAGGEVGDTVMVQHDENMAVSSPVNIQFVGTTPNTGMTLTITETTQNTDLVNVDTIMSNGEVVSLHLENVKVTNHIETDGDGAGVIGITGTGVNHINQIITNKDHSPVIHIGTLGLGDIAIGSIHTVGNQSAVGDFYLSGLTSVLTEGEGSSIGEIHIVGVPTSIESLVTTKKDSPIYTVEGFGGFIIRIGEIITSGDRSPICNIGQATPFTIADITEIQTDGDESPVYNVSVSGDIAEIVTSGNNSSVDHIQAGGDITNINTSWLEGGKTNSPVHDISANHIGHIMDFAADSPVSKINANHVE